MKFKHFLFALLIFTISCNTFKAAQAPKADATARVMTQTLSVQIATFYAVLSANSDKTFATHASEYESPSAAIRTLAIYDSSRKHSDALMIIVHDTEARFHTYEHEHQSAGKLNNAQILAYKEGMDALLDILVRTENHYK